MAAPRRPNPDRIIDSTMRLAAERRWRDVTMRDIADTSKISLADLHDRFANKGAIVAAFTARIDAKVIAETDVDSLSEPVRDRLFDVLVRRLEALQPHRAALSSIGRDAVLTPEAGLAMGCRLMRSMSWSLEAAGVAASGPLGQLRVKGLVAIYLATLMVFLRDDSADFARTMANLDRALGRADALMSRLHPFSNRGYAAPTVPAADPTT